jgi:pimeloyl-ACP methyl ester carboxylesterase
MADIAGPTDGETVLLLHGFPQTRHTWRAELPALATAGFRACAPDQRGYSAGARPEGIDAYRVEHLVADVLAIASSLGAERFHLVGHDWGGQLAWVVAALHPERVRSLSVLSRPHPAAFVRAMSADSAQPSRSRHHRAFQRPRATDEILADGCARLRAIYAGQGVPQAEADAYLATLGERPALDAAINWYRAAGSSEIRAAEVPAVRVPTLYVWGDADATVGREAAVASGSFVDAPYRFVELAGIGHFLTDEAPGAIPPLLVEHLRNADNSEKGVEA